MITVMLVAAPALLAFSCDVKNGKKGPEHLEINFRDVRPNGRFDVSLSDLTISDPKTVLGFLTRQDVSVGIEGRMTPAESIEIFPQKRDKAVTSWVRLNQVGASNKFNLEARFFALVMNHIGLEEKASGTCVRSVKKESVK